eukprot:1656019-Lingulodinium_polyedra.AAC.1
MTQRLLKEGVQRMHEMHERRLGGLLWGPSCERRACVEHVQKLLRSSKLDPQGKAIVTGLVCDGLWTPQRAFEAGYDLNPECCKCGHAHDSLWHRI